MLAVYLMVIFGNETSNILHSISHLVSSTLSHHSYSHHVSSKTEDISYSHNHKKKRELNKYAHTSETNIKKEHKHKFIEILNYFLDLNDDEKHYLTVKKLKSEEHYYQIFEYKLDSSLIVVSIASYPWLDLTIDDIFISIIPPPPKSIV